jgi:hypothetical protein
MAEQNGRVAQQDGTEGAAGQTGAPVSAPGTEEVAEQAAQVAAQEEAARQEAERQCEGIRKAAVKAFRQAEGAYRKGLLETGRLCHEYLLRRMAPPIRASRDAAVQALEGMLAVYSTREVDVNELVRCWAAHSLLCEAQQLKADVPYGHYQQAWSQLAERQEKNTPQEHWALLPGLEEECLAAYRECVEHSTDREGVKKRVAAIVADYARRVAAAKDRQSREADERATELRRQAEGALAALEAKQEQVAEVVQQAGRAQTEEQKRAASEQVAKAREELYEEQKRQQELERKRQEAEKEKARREREAREAAKAKERAERKAAGQAGGRGGRREGAAEGPCRAENLLAQSRHATVRDAGAFAAGVVNGHPQPDDVLEALLTLLGQSAQLSAKGKRACKAALVSLARKEGPAPAEAAANGPAKVPA